MSSAFQFYFGDAAPMRPFATGSRILGFPEFFDSVMFSLGTLLGRHWSMHDQWPNKRAEVIVNRFSNVRCLC